MFLADGWTAVFKVIVVLLEHVQPYILGPSCRRTVMHHYMLLTCAQSYPDRSNKSTRHEHSGKDFHDTVAGLKGYQNKRVCDEFPDLFAGPNEPPSPPPPLPPAGRSVLVREEGRLQLLSAAQAAQLQAATEGVSEAIAAVGRAVWGGVGGTVVRDVLFTSPLAMAVAAVSSATAPAGSEVSAADVGSMNDWLRTDAAPQVTSSSPGNHRVSAMACDASGCPAHGLESENGAPALESVAQLQLRDGGPHAVVRDTSSRALLSPPDVDSRLRDSSQPSESPSDSSALAVARAPQHQYAWAITVEAALARRGTPSPPVDSTDSADADRLLQAVAVEARPASVRYATASTRYASRAASTLDGVFRLEPPADLISRARKVLITRDEIDRLRQQYEAARREGV